MRSVFNDARRGFTLIELLVVLSIIGILSAVVLTSLNSSRQRGRDARRINDVRIIQLALDVYSDANNAYPVTLGTDSSNSVLVTGGYMASLPKDPSNGATYSYTPYAASANPGVCISYHLGTSLETGATHPELQQDADLAAYPAGMTLCTGGATDFSGVDTGKCRTSPADVGSACYDVRP